MLRRRAVLDRPNERSSHRVPTPRGGGLAIMAVVLPGWAGLATAGAPAAIWVAVGGAAALAAISFLDDLRPLPVVARLVAQLAAVTAGIAFLPGAGTVFQGALPPLLDSALAALLWLWFLNLYNFMDGIDGIAGVETVCLGIGIAVIAAVSPVLGLPSHPLLAAIIAAAALGFLCWNWEPARLFMGDVGSVPLGFLLGWLLLSLAAAGAWEASLILPLYYLADAGWTLARRLLRGAPVWQAHREHFYQGAVQNGLSHAAVVLRVLAADLVLVGLAVWAAPGRGGAALLLALAVVAVLLVDLSRRRR